MAASLLIPSIKVSKVLRLGMTPSLHMWSKVPIARSILPELPHPLIDDGGDDHHIRGKAWGCYGIEEPLGLLRLLCPSEHNPWQGCYMSTPGRYKMILSSDKSPESVHTRKESKRENEKEAHGLFFLYMFLGNRLPFSSESGSWIALQQMCLTKCLVEMCSPTEVAKDTLHILKII